MGNIQASRASLSPAAHAQLYSIQETHHVVLTAMQALAELLLASCKNFNLPVWGRRTTSGTSANSPLAYSARQYNPGPSPEDRSQHVASYIEGAGWSTPAVVSPRVALGAPGGSSPLGRQSSILPDWSFPEEAQPDEVLSTKLDP